MQDTFSGKRTIIRGAQLPQAADQKHLLDDNRRRLEAFDRLRAAAAKCGIRTDPDRDLFTLPEDAVSLLEGVDGHWAELGAAIREFRNVLPLVPLSEFGFPAESEDALAEGSPVLRHIGGGVEAWAFEAADQSVYKFFRPIDAFWIGATFRFTTGAEQALQTEACPGSYRDLLEKIEVINLIGGMPTEVVAITPEGVLVTKQTLGERLPENTDTSPLLPAGLISWPSRFLRCDRDHPRLTFVHGRPWLVADPHDRNVVRTEDRSARIIDVVAAPLPEEIFNGYPLMRDWIERARHDPRAEVLAAVDDAEL